LALIRELRIWNYELRKKSEGGRRKIGDRSKNRMRMGAGFIGFGIDSRK